LFFFNFYICTTNHKVIGLNYLIVSVFTGFLAFSYSMLIRFELSTFGVFVLFGDYQFYNSVITTHGLVMIFGFIMPFVLGGFVNYWTPLLLGCPDMLFPRLNNLSFWLYVNGVLFVALGATIEEGIGLGWTLYPSLCLFDFHSSVSVDFTMLSVHLLGISSIINSINLICTIVVCKRKFFPFYSISLFLWGSILTSFLLCLVLPILAGAVTMVLCDRNFNTSFFDVLGGGDLLLFQHLFWFFGHPEVYIIILPIFGIVSFLLEVENQKAVFSTLSMIYSMLMISFLGFFVWAHHMFTSGLDVDSRSYFAMITLIIGVPTCVKVFNWLYTFWSSDLLYKMEIFYVIQFLVMFLLGGVTGLLLANAGLDVIFHDTYFVVAHFHFVLSLGAVVGAFAGFYFILSILLKNVLSMWLHKINFLCFFVGSFMLFFPLHYLGLFGFPRRVTDYPITYLNYNYFSFIGAITLCFSIFIFYGFSFSLFFEKSIITQNAHFSFSNFKQNFFVESSIFLLVQDFLHFFLDSGNIFVFNVQKFLGVVSLSHLTGKILK